MTLTKIAIPLSRKGIRRRTRPPLVRACAAAILVVAWAAASTPATAAPAGPSDATNLERCQAYPEPDYWTPDMTATINGTESWNHVVRFLGPGEAIRIAALPSSRVKNTRWPWDSGYGPNGDGIAAGPEFPAPGVSRYGLVGGVQGDLRLMGVGPTCYVNTTGVLQGFQLTVNDGEQGDNSEGFVVTIVTFKDPEPGCPVLGTSIGDQCPAYYDRRGYDPAYALKRCKNNSYGEREVTADFGVDKGFEPVRVTLFPGESFRVDALDAGWSLAPVPGYGGGPGDSGTSTPTIKVGSWPWDGSYTPDGAGVDHPAPEGWPAPYLPQYGLIGTWEGQSGYFWVGAHGGCLQWAGARPVTLALTMNDNNIGDNEGVWWLRVRLYSPDPLPPE
ncbi:hypothetical protein DFR70_10476 [Nocardia tenerifensis]|uniref:Uncharacterized protein n=1 Tax=Nocardia tenerifensis TaxID=228006 RepID=A0A318K721_9NOCA|nr:hypothetical protein [Nocardia tenerifensis]PXX65015.1 hypothetical protein DFR70_10476 [Nocardia tenerifensis]